MRLHHGSRATYERHGCRCTDCVTAYRKWRQTANDRRNKRLLLTGIPSSVVHGRATTYKNWKCRCADCVKAYAAYRSEYTARAAARDEGMEGVK